MGACVVCQHEISRCAVALGSWSSVRRGCACSSGRGVAGRQAVATAVAGRQRESARRKMPVSRSSQDPPAEPGRGRRQCLLCGYTSLHSRQSRDERLLLLLRRRSGGAASLPARECPPETPLKPSPPAAARVASSAGALSLCVASPIPPASGVETCGARPVEPSTWQRSQTALPGVMPLPFHPALPSHWHVNRAILVAKGGGRRQWGRAQKKAHTASWSAGPTAFTVERAGPPCSLCWPSPCPAAGSCECTTWIILRSSRPRWPRWPPRATVAFPPARRRQASSARQATLKSTTNTMAARPPAARQPGARKGHERGGGRGKGVEDR